MTEADLGVRRGCLADLASYARGLWRFWDPRGRSARTELSLIVGVPAFFHAVVALPLTWFTNADWIEPLPFALALLAAIPLPAAAARRLHDMGKSGWLALPVLGLAAIGVWTMWLDLISEPFDPAHFLTGTPQARLIYGASWVLLAVLLMQPPRHENNRHGPDPRPRQKVI